MTIRELDLIRRVQEGEPGAFARLVDAYQAPVFQSIHKILGDADAAADVTQQAFIAAYENIHHFDTRHRFFSWLYRIAYNGAMNQLNRRKLHCPLGDFEIPWPGPPPDARVQVREQNSLVNEALAALEYKYRVLLVLRHFLNFSYAEIALIIDLPTTTVRSRIHTARHLLRDRLLEYHLLGA